jgi:acetyltransferase-like isoleucine patch superfamily enzyme
VRGRLDDFRERRRAPGLSKGRGVRIDRTARIWTDGGQRVEIADDSRIEYGALLSTYGGYILVGRRCSIGPYCVLYGHGGLTIGDDVLIAAHVVIVPSNHNIDDPTIPIRDQWTTDVGIRIESNVWIAARATILDGVTIGSGSVVAAGAVVTRDVQPNSIVGGVPARVLRDRVEKSSVVRPSTA